MADGCSQDGPNVGLAQPVAMSHAAACRLLRLRLRYALSAFNIPQPCFNVAMAWMRGVFVCVRVLAMGERW